MTPHTLQQLHRLAFTANALASDTGNAATVNEVLTWAESGELIDRAVRSATPHDFVSPVLTTDTDELREHLQRSANTFDADRYFVDASTANGWSVVVAMYLDATS